jgi:hypothetical protein
VRLHVFRQITPMVSSEGFVAMNSGLVGGALKSAIPFTLMFVVCAAFLFPAYAVELATLSTVKAQLSTLPVDDPWADTVLSFNGIDRQPGFTDPAEALGAPTGGGTLAPNNGKAYCIGKPGPAPGSNITLRFNTPVANDPDNPMGLDFVVHGNAFWVGGVPTRRWSESAMIEISEDVNGNGLADDPWYVIPGSRNLSASVLPAGISNPSPPLAGNVFNANADGKEQDWGYSDMSPTIQEYRDNYMRPDDPLMVGLTPYSGGGDAFDISWAVKSDGTPANLSKFDFIRISAFVNGSVSGFGAVMPEVSAAVDIDPLTDTDKDGVSDSYETRVSGTDPLRPESTVLPLEIPAEYGGSPTGTPLGQAKDAVGNAITLFSKGPRTGTRLLNCSVDILPVLSAVPLPSIPGLLSSAATRDFRSIVPDFVAAQIQAGQFTLAYTSSQVAGLDEASLEPWRFDGIQWTQSGITGVQRDPANNLVAFRSTVSGIFTLASPAGSGDQNVTAIPVVLHPAPMSGIVANGVNTVVFESDPILDGGTPVKEGTLLAVTVSPPELAAIITADADPAVGGVQVAVGGGRVTFSLRAATGAGRATVRAATADGLIAGAIPYMFLSGPPDGPTPLWVQNPNATAPGPIYFYTGEIHDANGNPVTDGTLLTLEVIGALPVGAADADPGAEGFQVRTAAGIANFSVSTDAGKAGDSRAVTVRLYADPARQTVLADETFVFDYVPVPGPSVLPIALILLAAGIAASLRNPGHRSWNHTE